MANKLLLVQILLCSEGSLSRAEPSTKTTSTETRYPDGEGPASPVPLWVYLWMSAGGLCQEHSAYRQLQHGTKPGSEGKQSSMSMGGFRGEGISS